MLPADATSTATQKTTPPPMSDAEEIHQLKVQLAQARYKRQQEAATKAQQKAADDNVTKKKQALDPHLKSYNTHMKHHQDQWVRSHQTFLRHHTQAQAQQAWWNDWQISQEGKDAENDVAPYLADYNAAVKQDLRLTAQDIADHGGDAKAIQAGVAGKADQLKPKGDSFEDSITSDIVDKAGNDVGGVIDKKTGQVTGAESDEKRRASINVYDAITTRDQALANLHDVQTRRDKALAGVHNAGLRKEISDGFTDEINSAQAAVDAANDALQSAVDTKFVILVSEGDLKDAQASLDKVKGEPPRLRKIEMLDAQDYLGTAEHQHELAVDGKLDLTSLTQFTPDELNAAYGEILADNPELMITPDMLTGQSASPNAQVAKHLFETVAMLPYRPTLDANLAGLTVDKSSPQWMQDLVAKGDRTTAALAMSLGVGNVQPDKGPETVLAEKDPLAFIMLVYSDPAHQADLQAQLKLGKDNQTIDDATVIQKGEELASAKFDALMAEQAPGESDAAFKERTARAQKLIGMFGASGLVRANDVRQQWEQFTATHTVEQSLEQMGEYLEEEDYNNPDAEPTSDIGRFMRSLQTNMAHATSVEDQALIWNGIGDSVVSFIGQQADYIRTHFSNKDTYSAIIGEWQKQMGQFAAPQVADAVIDATTTHFDPALTGKMGGGRMVDGLQILADRAPGSAGKIAAWAVGGTDDPSYPIPLTELVSVKHDGTGATLGEAILNQLATKGMDPYGFRNIQDYYTASLHDWQKDAGKTAGKQSFDNFNAHLHTNVQDVFDSIVKGTGDLYTKPHQLGANGPKRDNEYGRKLKLAPDVHNTGGDDTVALYTDPAKLAKIHKLEEINLLSRGLNLPVDIDALAPLIASGVDPLSDRSPLDATSRDNLRKINKAGEWIREVGGDHATITFMPAIYTSPSQGVQVDYLLRVAGDKNNDGVITRDETTRSTGNRSAVTLADEDMIIDTSMLGSAVDGQNVTWKYTDFHNYQTDNSLDDHGKLYMATANAAGDMVLSTDRNGRVDNINFDGVDAAITTTWEHVRRWGDVLIGIAGLAAGLALTIETGGLAAPLVAGAAAVWFGMRTIETADEMSTHGESFNPINTHADGAWFGFIDPTAGGFWLGAIASASGLAEMRPFALAGSVSRLGREATAVDELPLAQAGIGSTKQTDFSRNIGTDLFGSNGVQTNLYRAQLAALQSNMSLFAKVYARGLSWTSLLSGGALTAGQGWSFVHMIANGQMDWSNWSIESPIWDFALAGGGAASMGFGFAHGRQLKNRAAAAPVAEPRTAAKTELPSNPVVLSAHKGEDGTLLLRRVNVDGLALSDPDAALRPGTLPPGLVIVETSAQEGGGVALDNIHFLSPNGDSPAYKTGTIEALGTTSLIEVDAATDGAFNPLEPDGTGRTTHPVRLRTEGDGETAPPEESVTGLDRWAYALAAQLGKGAHTEDGAPVSAAQRTQLEDLFTEVDDQFLAGIASYRRPQIRTASDALYIVRPSLLRSNAANRLPPGTDTSAFTAFVAYHDGEASAIFVEDTLSQRSSQTQRDTIGHELAHYYAHPDFVRLAMRLRTDPGNPLRNLGEGAADYIAPGVLGGADADIAGSRYSAEMRVIGNIVRRIGKETFYRAFFQGDAAALNAFYNAAMRTGEVTWAGDAGAIFDYLPGFAGTPRPRIINADSYTGGQWKGFYENLKNGTIAFPEDRYVYVVATPKGTGTAAFGRDDIVFRGTIRAGSRDVTQWRARAASGTGWESKGPRNVGGRTSSQVFGPAPAGKQFHVIVTDAKPGSVLNTKAEMSAPGVPAGSRRTRRSPLSRIAPSPQNPLADIPISGQGYAASDWSLFYKRLQSGQLQYRGDRYLYVVEVPRDNSLKLKPAELRAVARLPRGATDVTWDNSAIQGTADRTFEPAVGGKKVADIFDAPGGKPSDGRVYKFFVTHLPPDRITGAAGVLNVNYRAVVPGARPSVSGRLPSDPQRNPYRNVNPKHEERLIGGIARDAARLRKQGATLDDVLDSIFSGFPGGRPTLEPTPLLVQQLDVIQHNEFIETHSHQGHEHPEGYDARLTPEGEATGPIDRATRPVSRRLASHSGSEAMQKWEQSVAATTDPTRIVPDDLLRVLGLPSGTPYTVRLALVRGPYTENWIAGIPQNCGNAGHYTALDPRAPTYRGSPALDERHISEYRNVVANFGDWVGYMKRVATDLGPDTAARIDMLAFERKDADLKTYLDGLPIDPVLKDQIYGLASTDQTRPHLALNMHIAITGFRPASRESAFYLVDRFIEYYQLIGGVGETTLIKENVNKQLEALGEHFDFDNPDHRLGLMVWMTTTKLFEKHAQIHSDNHEAPLGGDGRLLRGIKDPANAYDQRHKFVRLFAPFAKVNPAAWFLKSGGVTHAHAGGGRYAELDTTLVANTHPDVNGLNYGPKITRQVDEMERLVRDNPDFLSDNSWNDNSFAVSSNADLRRDYQIFARRHHLLINASDTVKPVNIGQARQHGTDDLPWKVELGLTDKQALLHVMRKSFERTVHGGKLDAAKLQTIADQFDDLVGRIESGNSTGGSYRVLDDIAAAFISETTAAGNKDEIVDTLKALADKIRHAPPPKEYPLMDKVWNGETFRDAGGNDVVIVRGRKQARELAEIAIANHSFEDVRRKVASWDVADEPVEPVPTGPLPAYFQPKRPVVHDTTDTVQAATSAGFRRAPAGKGQATAEFMGDLAPILAGLAAGGFTAPGVGDIASTLRQAIFNNITNRLENERIRWENIHEEAQATDDSLNVYLGQVLKVGSEIGVDPADLKKLAVLLEQLRTDFIYIREQTASWPAERRFEIFDLQMASVGNSQIRGDATVGVQTSALSTANARTKAGRARLKRINAAAAATLGAGAMNTLSIFQHPEFTGLWENLKYGSLAQTTVTSVALGIMIGRNIATSRSGRALTNPELNRLYTKLQYNVLRWIKYSAGASAAYDALSVAATQLDHNGSWVEPTVKGIVSLATFALTARAQKYEGMTLLDSDVKGRQMPAKAANTTKWVLASLAVGALTGLVFQALRDGKDFLDKEDKKRDGLKYANDRLQAAKTILAEDISAFNEADRNLTAARNGFTTADNALTTAQNAFNNLPANATAQQRQQAQNDLDRAKAARGDAQTALDAAQAIYDAARASRDKAQQTVNDIQGQINTLTAALAQLQTAKTTLGTRQGALDTAGRNLTAAKTAFTTADRAFTKAQSDLDALPANATAQQRQQAQTALDNARTARDGASTALNAAQSQYDAARKARDDAQAAVNDAQKGADAVNVDYQEAEDSWQRDFFPLSELIPLP